MPVNFFEKEWQKAVDRFNKTFGVLDVCDIRTRQKAMLTIIRMGRLKDKIMQSNNKNVMEERSKFIKAKNWLNNIYSQIDDELNERRNHANTNKTGNHSTGTGAL